MENIDAITPANKKSLTLSSCPEMDAARTADPEILMELRKRYSAMADASGIERGVRSDDPWVEAGLLENRKNNSRVIICINHQPERRAVILEGPALKNRVIEDSFYPGKVERGQDQVKVELEAFGVQVLILSERGAKQKAGGTCSGSDK